MADFDSRAFKRFCEGVLSKLATYQAACDCGNRVEAGRVLGIGGPAVGKAIASIEEALRGPLNGGPLVDHSGPLHVIQTEAGELLSDYVGKIRDLSATFLSALETLQHGSNVKLAMTRSAWITYGRELEAAYRKLRPEGTVDFGQEFYSKDTLWKEIEDSLLSGDKHLGVYSFPPSRKKKRVEKGGIPKGILHQELVEEEIVLVLPGGSKGLPKGKEISLRQLRSPQPVVHYRRSLGFDRTLEIEGYLGRQGLLDRYSGDWLLGVDTISEMKDTLLKMGGMSFLPWPDVESEHREGTLRAYRLIPPTRSRIVYLAYRPQTSRPATRDFLRAAATLPRKREFKP